MKKIIEILHLSISKFNNTSKFIVLGLLAISVIIASYCWLQPTTVTTQNITNTINVRTDYNYQATITPNRLYPEGGTFDVNNAILLNVTDKIPVTLQTTINSNSPIIVDGTQEIQLKLIAGHYWEKIFPLAKEKSFNIEGTEISLINGNYDIDLKMIKSFIAEVEKEVSIRPEFYTLEINPNINGTLHYNGNDQLLAHDNKLVFQIYFNEVLLASDKSFDSSYPFTFEKSEVNTINLAGLIMPVKPVRLLSSLCTLLFLLISIGLFKNQISSKYLLPVSENEKIQKKYGNRLIPVTQKTDSTPQNIITLNSIKSLVQIADVKDLPIFHYQFPQQPNNHLYFMIEGDYTYHFNVTVSPFVRSRVQQKNNKTEAESESQYAKG